MTDAYKTQRIDTLLDLAMKDIKDDICQTKDACLRIEGYWMDLSTKVSDNATLVGKVSSKLTIITRIVFMLLAGSLAGGALGVYAADMINNKIVAIRALK